MGIKQLYNDNLRKLPNEYGDVSVMSDKQMHVTCNCKSVHCIYAKSVACAVYKRL